MHPIIQAEVDEFEKEFRAYLWASINYAEVQEPYRPLDSEDEIKWLKSFLSAALHRAVEKAGKETTLDREEMVKWIEANYLDGDKAQKGQMISTMEVMEIVMYFWRMSKSKLDTIINFKE